MKSDSGFFRVAFSGKSEKQIIIGKYYNDEKENGKASIQYYFLLYILLYFLHDYTQPI